MMLYMLLYEFDALQGRIGRVLGRKWRKPVAENTEKRNNRSAAPVQGR
jgi:hypothetical protein